MKSGGQISQMASIKRKVAANKPVGRSNKPVVAATELPETPHERFRPEFLGEIWVLSSSVPNYMPNNEADLVEWIKIYLRQAAEMVYVFPPVFGASAKYPVTKLQIEFNNLITARTAANLAADYARGLQTFARIVLRARDHAVAVPVPTYVPTVAPNKATMAGLVGMIDFQVRLLRETDGFTQATAEQLGIIPRAPGNVDLDTVTPGLCARNRGGRVNLSFRGPAGIRGVKFVCVQVDRGDGHWHDLVTIASGSFSDVHMQPDRPSTWIYRTYFIDEVGVRVGLISEAGVIVGG